MAGNQTLQPDVQVVQIKDFSPGIFRYGVGSLSLNYSPQAPLGSASYAVRCINQPGIGLIPFYGYSSFYTQVISNSITWTFVTAAGLGVVGGNAPNTLLVGNEDTLVLSIAGTDSSNSYNIGNRILQGPIFRSDQAEDTTRDNTARTSGPS